MIDVIVLKDFFDKEEKVNRVKNKKFQCSKDRADYLKDKELIKLNTQKSVYKNKRLSKNDE